MTNADLELIAEGVREFVAEKLEGHKQEVLRMRATISRLEQKQSAADKHIAALERKIGDLSHK